MVTPKEKEAIDMVVGLLDRRIKWLKENEPAAKNEIQANENAVSMVCELEHLEIS